MNYTYDAAGNVTNDGAHSYTYDAENRLVSVDGGATAQYGYDQSNRRIKKTIGGVTTHCVWEGAKVIAENTASSGAVNVEYVYSGNRMLASIAGGVTRYYLADRLSARLVLDNSGNIIGRQAHLPFGEELNVSGTTDKHRFTSYERDSETGTDYAVNRGYSSGAGKFLQADPYRASGGIRDPQSWNRYSYTRNRPVDRIDPRGLDDTPTNPPPGGTPIKLSVTGCKAGGYPEDYSSGECPDDDPFFKTGSILDGDGFADPNRLPLRPLPPPNQTMQTAPFPSLGDLRAKIDELLRKKGNKCGNFVQTLINQAAKDTGRAFYSDNALELFDAISGPEGGSYVFEQAVVGGRPVNGTVRGGFGNPGFPHNTPTVIISPRTYWNEFSHENAQRGYIYTALHETIHLAGVGGHYTDLELARAIFNLGGLSQKQIDDFNKIKDVTDASGFWGNILVDNCRQ